MYYAVIQRPDIDTSLIEAFRMKYDPNYGLVGPHVTLVFPVDSAKLLIGKLQQHIKSVAQRSQPFSVDFADFELSWDQWLFLTPIDGRQQLVKLHNNLYEDMLAPMLRTDIPFVPHIALGHFAFHTSDYNLYDPKAVPLDEEKYQLARLEIDNIGPKYRYRVSKLELISINDEFTSSQFIAEFMLG